MFYILVCYHTNNTTFSNIRFKLTLSLTEVAKCLKSTSKSLSQALTIKELYMCRMYGQMYTEMLPCTGIAT